jgi:hypothetical protein
MFQHGKSLCLATLLPIATACFFFNYKILSLPFIAPQPTHKTKLTKKRGLE